MSVSDKPPETRCENCDEPISIHASTCLTCGESVWSYRRAKYQFYFLALLIPFNLFIGYLLAFGWEEMGVWSRIAALGMFFGWWVLLYFSYEGYSRRKQAMEAATE